MQQVRLDAPVRTLASPARRLVGLVMSVSLLGLLAALPTASSAAETPTITSLPVGEVETVLAKTPLSALPAAALGELLAGLPALNGVEASAVEEALEQTIQTLTSKGDTLGQLLSGGESATLLAGELKAALGLLGPLLETFLGGNPVTKLTEALESTTAGQVLGELAGGSTEPEQLIGGALAAIEPAALLGLLGTTLSGEPFAKLDVAELAGQLGLAPSALVEALGQTLASAPESALALTAPLTDGKTLSILDGTGGLVLGTVEHVAEKIGEGTKGGGEGGGSGGGGSGGAGGSGSSGGSGGSTTVLVLQPTQTPSPVAAGAATLAGKLKVISRRVRRHQATVVVQVPAAGLLSTAAHGVRAVHHETARAGRVTLHLALTAAGTAALRRHHRVRIPVRITFKPVAGPSSSASVALSFG